jgi:hypothetical protein
VRARDEGDPIVPAVNQVPVVAEVVGYDGTRFETGDRAVERTIGGRNGTT